MSSKGTDAAKKGQSTTKAPRTKTKSPVDEDRKKDQKEDTPKKQPAEDNDKDKRPKKVSGHVSKKSGDVDVAAKPEYHFEEAHNEHQQIKEKIVLLKNKLQDIQQMLVDSYEERDDSFLQSCAQFIDVSAFLPPGTSATDDKEPAKSTQSAAPEVEAKPIPISANFSPYPSPVFGVPLKNLSPDGSAHYFWRVCVHFLLSPSALNAEGVWRVPGNSEEIQYYKKCFDEGKEVIFKCSHFDVAGLFKQWIRELPEPLIPPLFDAQIPYILDEHKADEDNTGLVNDIRALVTSLPKPNFVVVSLLGGLLAELAKNSEVNKMPIDNIIKCIVPTVGCVPALFLWIIKCPEIIFGGRLVQEESL